MYCAVLDEHIRKDVCRLNSSTYFKVIRFDPLAFQTLAQGVLCKWKCSFLSVTSWIWTAAPKRFFSHFLKYDMIYFVLPKSSWFYCYRNICYFDGIWQIGKSNRWTCIFLLRVAINKALPVIKQSSGSFVYIIKHIQAERYDLLPKNRSGLGVKMQEQSVLVPSQLITTAQKVVATEWRTNNC